MPAGCEEMARVHMPPATNMHTCRTCCKQPQQAATRAKCPAFRSWGRHPAWPPARGAHIHSRDMHQHRSCWCTPSPSGATPPAVCRNRKRWPSVDMHAVPEHSDETRRSPSSTSEFPVPAWRDLCGCMSASRLPPPTSEIQTQNQLLCPLPACSMSRKSASWLLACSHASHTQ